MSPPCTRSVPCVPQWFAIGGVGAGCPLGPVYSRVGFGDGAPRCGPLGTRAGVQMAGVAGVAEGSISRGSTWAPSRCGCACPGHQGRSFVAQEAAPVLICGGSAPLQSPEAKHGPRDGGTWPGEMLEMLLTGAGGDSRSKAIPWPQSAGATGTASHPAHRAELTQPPRSPGPVLVCGPSVPLLRVL